MRFCTKEGVLASRTVGSRAWKCDPLLQEEDSQMLSKQLESAEDIFESQCVFLFCWRDLEGILKVLKACFSGSVSRVSGVSWG